MTLTKNRTDGLDSVRGVCPLGSRLCLFAWIAGLLSAGNGSVPSTWLLVGIPCVAIVIWLLGQYRAARLAAILALIALFGMLRIGSSNRTQLPIRWPIIMASRSGSSA